MKTIVWFFWTTLIGVLVSVAVFGQEFQHVEVPEGKKIVLVDKDAPTLCVKIDFIELEMLAQDECTEEGDLQVSPGLPPCED